jgi:hypothetical protein
MSCGVHATGVNQGAPPRTINSAESLQVTCLTRLGTEPTDAGAWFTTQRRISRRFPLQCMSPALSHLRGAALGSLGYTGHQINVVITAARDPSGHSSAVYSCRIARADTFSRNVEVEVVQGT